MGQPKLTAIVQSRLCILRPHGAIEMCYYYYIIIMLPDPFWAHCMNACKDDNADAKRILSTLPAKDWRRPRGRPHIT